jgi:branched-chain amino acid transport system substrate-binding protein
VQVLKPDCQAKKAVSVVLIALSLVLVSTVSGCAGKAEETIRIGAVYPFTGSLAATGSDLKNGVLFAMDIINNQYDLDLPLASSEGMDLLNGAEIEIVFGDSQGSPSVGSSEVERLINE